MRQTFRGLVHSCRRYGIVTKVEVIPMVVTSIVFGFILTFRMWGEVGEVFNPMIGIYNWLMFSVFSFLALVAMTFGYKFMAYEMGYYVTYEYWKVGLTLNTFICFLTNGFAVFLTMGGYDVKRNPGTQIGKNYWGVLYTEKAFLVFWSFVSVVIYTILVKMIFPLKIAQGMTTTAYIIAFWSLFPMDIVLKYFFREAPNSNGTSLVTGCWSFGVFTIIFLAISAALNYYLAAFWPLIVSLFFAIICYFVFYIFLDPKHQLYK